MLPANSLSQFISAATLGWDCVMIPGALKKSDNAMKYSLICGQLKGLVTADASTTNATVCSKKTPFMIQFFSDDTEDGEGGEGPTATQGFSLLYEQTSC